ncbi:MAG: DUF1294 domain-containing protein [Oscillospiraceae bacterium]|nr:DUF1294 domain-containing protein [Oscillospiraceae bacterium]
MKKTIQFLALFHASDTVILILAAVLLVMSLILFFVMGHDKALSKTHKRRVPEATLFLLAFLGGALGGVLGMQIFRHKTKHMHFVLGFPALMLVQWALLILLWLPN